jgi:NADH-quinone oxidoreductase subunit J
METGFLAATASSGGLLAGSNAIMAALGLGALGLFLMLPRDRATWVKLGALIGVLGLGWLFVQLAQAAAHDVPIFFYIFATIMIGGAVGVICHPKPVYAALYFVLVTLAGAGLFVLLMAEFMAVVLIIVYAGAILVTYVFVIMLASQGKKVTPLYDRAASEPLMAVLVSFVLLGSIVKVMYRDEIPSSAPAVATMPTHADPQMVSSLQAMDDEAPAAIKLAAPGNMQLLGLSLYGNYSLSLELAGVLLTIALVGAVVISRKNVDHAHEHEAGTGQLPAE